LFAWIYYLVQKYLNQAHIQVTPFALTKEGADVAGVNNSIISCVAESSDIVTQKGYK